MKKILILMISMMLVTAAMPASVFAAAINDTEYDDTTVRVYLTVSYDSDFLRAGADPVLTNRGGRVLARVPVDVSYVDLAEYGLEDYYRYEAYPFDQGGEYKTYQPANDGTGHYVWEATYMRHWWGPTKVEISLKWLIGSVQKKGGRR